jgi:hypothetical protein
MVSMDENIAHGTFPTIFVKKHLQRGWNETREAEVYKAGVSALIEIAVM